MKALIFATALALATAPAFATDTTTRAAQVVVSVARQIRLDHKGNYADLNPPQGTVMLPWGELTVFSGPYPDTRSFKHFGLHIDRQHVPLLTDHRRQLQRIKPVAAAHVAHGHAGLHAEVLQHLLAIFLALARIAN